MKNKHRIIHAISFEFGALVLFVIVLSPIFDFSVTAMGVMGITLSLLTVTLLYFYNIIFDKALLTRTGSVKKSSKARIMHALLFETSLIIIFLPIIIWWLKVGIIDALLLEVSAITFMVVYTFIFHWVVENYIYKTSNS